jgi:hypothetical protein
VDKYVYNSGVYVGKPVNIYTFVDNMLITVDKKLIESRNVDKWGET